MNSHHNLDMIKVPLLYAGMLLLSISNVEEGLRLAGLTATLAYTLYKFVSDYRKNKKEK